MQHVGHHSNLQSSHMNIIEELVQKQLVLCCRYLMSVTNISFKDAVRLMDDILMRVRKIDE